ncbi:hypothetical protein KUCAC02_020472 [Chaenocephalus aceratus]|nr:hypothetical protein KUCAC02_020472 [Chaenocephalus aceratus]
MTQRSSKTAEQDAIEHVILGRDKPFLEARKYVVGHKRLGLNFVQLVGTRWKYVVGHERLGLNFVQLQTHRDKMVKDICLSSNEGSFCDKDCIPKIQIQR